MKTVTLFLAAFTLVFLVLGCTRGILYTHTWEPLSLDMHKTPVGSKTGESDIKHLQIPLMWSVASDSNAIGDIAKQNGLKELYFADLETVRILSIWSQYWVHVYGK